jgi:hypothetical protein
MPRPTLDWKNRKESCVSCLIPFAWRLLAAGGMCLDFSARIIEYDSCPCGFGCNYNRDFWMLAVLEILAGKQHLISFLSS